MGSGGAAKSLIRTFLALGDRWPLVMVIWFLIDIASTGNIASLTIANWFMTGLQ